MVKFNSNLFIIFTKKYLKKSAKKTIYNLAVFPIIFGLFFNFYNIAFSTVGAPQIISYQGRLANSSGDLLTGTYYFRFSIWDSSTVGTGSQLWPAVIIPGTATTTVTSGVFNINIGDTANNYPDVLNYNFYDNADVYLEVQVSSPREV